MLIIAQYVCVWEGGGGMCGAWMCVTINKVHVLW